jgi:hypothetical protein
MSRPATAPALAVSPHRAFVGVHLTAAAPGCVELPIGDKRRWKAFHQASAREVVEALLRRLGKGPDDVSVRQAEIRNTARGRFETEVEVAIETDQGVLPAAYVCFGLDLADIRLALDELSRQQWRAPAQPSSNW